MFIKGKIQDTPVSFLRRLPLKKEAPFCVVLRKFQKEMENLNELIKRENFEDRLYIRRLAEVAK